jgi:hypothetical protein
MTQAVCFRCGEIKFGAFVVCPHCGGKPKTDDELVLSLAMTDHYFQIGVMRQMGDGIKNGTPPNLDEATRNNLLENLAEIRKTPVGKLLGDSPRSERKKSKWWPF